MRGYLVAICPMDRPTCASHRLIEICNPHMMKVMYVAWRERMDAVVVHFKYHRNVL